jgi:hypothetical protein
MSFKHNDNLDFCPCDLCESRRSAERDSHRREHDEQKQGLIQRFNDHKLEVEGDIYIIKFDQRSAIYDRRAKTLTAAGFDESGNERAIEFKLTDEDIAKLEEHLKKPRGGYKSKSKSKRYRKKSKYHRKSHRKYRKH